MAKKMPFEKTLFYNQTIYLSCHVLYGLYFVNKAFSIKNLKKL